MRAWYPHAALIGLALAMLAWATVHHTPTAVALRVAFDEEAPAEERIWAAHLVANRATSADPRLGDDLVRSFLRSEDERLREAALLIDLCRHAVKPEGAPPDTAPPIQDAYVYAPLGPAGWSPHRIRSLVLYRRKVGGARVGGVRRMELVEADWFLKSLDGGTAPSAEEVARYFEERDREAAALQRQEIQKARSR